MKTHLTALLLSSSAVSGFLTAPHKSTSARSSLVIRHLYNRDGDDNDDGDHESRRDEGTTPKIPQLPPAKFNSAAQGSSSPSSPAATAAGMPVVGDKFEIQYTCKKCETRNSSKVSRIAYRSGVVICVCRGCMANHWIADNLGWSDHAGGFQGEDVTNIEEYVSKHGTGTVRRVTEEVFHLERVWSIAQHPFLE